MISLSSLFIMLALPLLLPKWTTDYLRSSHWGGHVHCDTAPVGRAKCDKSLNVLQVVYLILCIETAIRFNTHA